MPLISLKNIDYGYAHNTAAAPLALSGVNLTIKPGEYVALVGANGSGKSTLARLLNGLILPTAGEVRVDGLSTREPANLDHIRETVGMVFQNPESQIVATSVADDIAFGLENLGLPQAEIERRVETAAARFGLTAVLGKEPHWLSGGQKQRTVLAGVVALNPRVLVLDEPSTMLDPRSRRDLMIYIDELWRAGAAIIHATQFMEEAAEAARLIALAAGRIAFDGAPGDFFTDDDLLESTGLAAPLAVRLRGQLGRRGFSLPEVLTPPQLVDAVCDCH